MFEQTFKNIDDALWTEFGRGEMHVICVLMLIR